MSDVVEQFSQLEPTFADGAMRMLKSEYAQTTVAIFKSVFGDGASKIDSEVFYAQVDAMLEELGFAGCKVWRHEDGSITSSREVIDEKWVREFKLLERRILPTSELEYSLRPEALAIMSAVDAIGDDAILLSSPRAEMIVEALTKLSIAVNPDPQAKRADLVAKVERAQRELDEFDATGGALAADADAIAMYRNALDLMSQVPVDMSRIEELMYTERNNLIDSFHEDDRPGGALVAEYLKRSDDLFSGTDSGQVYNGAIKMLSSRRLNAQISERVRMITRSDALADLEDQERLALERSWKHLVNGMNGVLKLRRSCSEAVANAIAQYDHDVYREYSALLKELYRLTLERGRMQSPFAKGPMPDAIGTAEVETIMYRLSAKPAKQPPPPLYVSDEVPQVDIGRLRYFAGPRTEELLDAIEEHMDTDESVLLSEVFNVLDADLRREVELTGLMRFAMREGLDLENAECTVYACVDYEGKERYWMAPSIVVNRGELDRERVKRDV